MYASAIDVALSVWLAFRYRALLRARGGEIPCTERMMSLGLLAAAVGVLLGTVLLNMAPVIVLDPGFGKQLNPAVFAVWLVAMSGVAILAILILSTRYGDRAASAWVRVEAPNKLMVRQGERSTTFALEPGAVLASTIPPRTSRDLVTIQYFFSAGEQRFALAVPLPATVRAPPQSGPKLERRVGLYAQGGSSRLHKFLSPFCAKAA